MDRMEQLDITMEQLLGQHKASEFAIRILMASLPDPSASLAQWDHLTAQLVDEMIESSTRTTLPHAHEAMQQQLARYRQCLEHLARQQASKR